MYRSLAAEESDACVEVRRVQFGRWAASRVGSAWHGYAVIRDEKRAGGLVGCSRW